MKKLLLAITTLLCLSTTAQLNREYYTKQLTEITIQDRKFSSLEQFYPLKNGFKVNVLPSGREYFYSPPKFYRNKETAIAVFPDGRIEGAISGYSITSRKGYYEIVEDLQGDFNCEVIDLNIPETENLGGFRTAKCVNLYIELGYDLYNTSVFNDGDSINGSIITNAVDYMMAVFAVMQTVYANDSVDIALQSMGIWEEDDSYGTGTTALLNFREARGGQPELYGDVACFFDNDEGGYGGVGFLNGLCTDYNVVFADISTGWEDYPNYYWNFLVTTHELGHVFNSLHTHNCTWVGGAIDGCYPSEGDCPDGAMPIDGGTIMSYCHLTGYGINFLNGFGAQPRAKIISTIESKECLADCGSSDTIIVISEFPSCVSYGENSSTHIDYIALKDMARTSGDDGGYFRYTADTLQLIATEYFKISFSSNTTTKQYWQAWVDWNGDGDFTTAGERVMYATTKKTGISNKYALASYATGLKKVRVSMSTDGYYPSSCDTIPNGEVEDFYIKVVDNTIDDEVPIVEYADVVVFNMQGAIVYSGRSDEMGYLPKGMYILVREGVISKFVVQ